jgi:phosphoenolpyruvate carboxylase
VLQRFFDDALIVPVLTAHPTEVQRKSILDASTTSPACSPSATSR